MAQSAGAATVTFLRLPTAFSANINALSDARTIALGRDGTIAAILNVQNRNGYTAVVGIWSRNQAARFIPITEVFEAVPQAVVVSTDSVFVTEGNSRALFIETFRFRRGHVDSVQKPRCVYSSGRYITAVDDLDRMATNFISTGVFGYRDEAITNPTAPYLEASHATVIERNRCISYGRGTLLNLRGAWAGGYRAYIGLRLTPYDQGGSRYMAVRWLHGEPSELGRGVIYAISRDGIAVGANILPSDSYNGPAKAVVWDRAGNARFIADDKRIVDYDSVAYDISDSGVVVGTIVTHEKISYAFIWRNGTLRRLDDLPHPPGWHFESAYVISANGTIVGSAIRHGVRAIFKYAP